MSKEEIPSSKRSMLGNILAYSRSSAFSSDGTLISASADPHWGKPSDHKFLGLVVEHRANSGLLIREVGRSCGKPVGSIASIGSRDREPLVELGGEQVNHEA